MSYVTCPTLFILFIGKSGEANRWRLCYQQSPSNFNVCIFHFYQVWAWKLLVTESYYRSFIIQALFITVIGWYAVHQLGVSMFWHMPKVMLFWYKSTQNQHISTFFLKLYPFFCSLNRSSYGSKVGLQCACNAHAACMRCLESYNPSHCICGIEKLGINIHIDIPKMYMQSACSMHAA